MVQFENPEIAEGINAPPEHPLKEFAQLVVGIGVVCVIVVGTLSYLAGRLAHYIPFHYEQSMVGDFVWHELQDGPEQQRLETLVAALLPSMNLPEGMQITVHYSNDETVNALATLGGHIVVFQGLLEQLPNDEALAAVLAHEIAHVKLRHPIVALGRGATVLTLGAVLTGASSSHAGDWLIGSSINLQMLQYSRQQELQADQLAAEAMLATYGRITGLQQVFTLFAELEADSQLAAMQVEALRSHPYSSERLSAINQVALTVESGQKPER